MHTSTAVRSRFHPWSGSSRIKWALKHFVARCARTTESRWKVQSRQCENRKQAGREGSCTEMYCCSTCTIKIHRRAAGCFVCFFCSQIPSSSPLSESECGVWCSGVICGLLCREMHHTGRDQHTYEEEAGAAAIDNVSGSYAYLYLQ